jgi:hypothetical protein
MSSPPVPSRLGERARASEVGYNVNAYDDEVSCDHYLARALIWKLVWLEGFGILTEGQIQHDYIIAASECNKMEHHTRDVTPLLGTAFALAFAGTAGTEDGKCRG